MRFDTSLLKKLCIFLCSIRGRACRCGCPRTSGEPDVRELQGLTHRSYRILGLDEFRIERQAGVRFVRLNALLDDAQQGIRDVFAIELALGQSDGGLNDLENERRIHGFSPFPVSTRIAFVRSRRFLLSCARYASEGTFVATAPR